MLFKILIRIFLFIKLLKLILYSDTTAHVFDKMDDVERPILVSSLSAMMSRPATHIIVFFCSEPKQNKEHVVKTSLY